MWHIFSVLVFVDVCDSLSLESCSESGLMGVGSLHERLKLLALRSAKADGVRGEESHSQTLRPSEGSSVQEIKGFVSCL